MKEEEAFQSRDYLSPRERGELDQRRFRDRILAAAEDLLNEEGPEKLSVRGIARRISYAPASLYHYFPDKEAIVTAILARGGERIGEAIAAAIEAAADPVTALRSAFRAYVATSMERPALARLVYLTGRSGGASRSGTGNVRPGASAANPNLARMASIVRDAQESGMVGELDVDMTVRSLWTAAQGLVIRLALDGVEPGLEREQLVEGYLELLMHGLLRRDS